MKSKGANENESRQIMYLMAGMASGLKILCSSHNPTGQQWDGNMCLTL
jgi:bifunctional pyridoxal-dependent enzyme with beta-cystathionase and maltose regulon repressor activities